MNQASSNPNSPAAPHAGGGNAGGGAAPSPTFSPLYQQIKALITQSLQSGEWKPGELIPSEVELAGRAGNGDAHWGFSHDESPN